MIEIIGQITTAGEIIGQITGGIVQGASLELLDAKVDKTTTINAKPLSSNVTLTASDIGSTPAGGIAATTVQAAINELDTEKASQLHLTEKTSFGVISGLVTSAQSTPNMTVKVSAGVIYMENGDRFAPSAVSSIAVTSADATNPRIDIVYVSSTGVVSYLAGTASVTPAQPTVPAGGQLLATINVSANATSIVAGNIAQRKKGLWVEDWITPTLLNGWSVLSYPVMFRRDSFGQVVFSGWIQNSPATDSVMFMLPAGYRPKNDVRLALGASGGYMVIRITTGGEVRWNWGVNTASLDAAQFPTY